MYIHICMCKFMDMYGTRLICHSSVTGHFVWFGFVLGAGSLVGLVLAK